MAEALAGSRSSRLVYVHGRGGVGKSALCRAVARDAELGGYRVHRLDGRTLTPDPDELRAAFVAAADHSALLIIDEIDQLAAMRVAVRDLLVQVMPASSVVVLVGRCAPDRTWFDAGLDQVVVELRLRPLGHADALELLCRLGVHDAAVCGRLVRWSGFAAGAHRRRPVRRGAAPWHAGAAAGAGRRRRRRGPAGRSSGWWRAERRRPGRARRRRRRFGGRCPSVGRRTPRRPGARRAGPAPGPVDGGAVGCPGQPAPTPPLCGACPVGLHRSRSLPNAGDAHRRAFAASRSPRITGCCSSWPTWWRTRSYR